MGKGNPLTEERPLFVLLFVALLDTTVCQAPMH